MVNKKKIHLVLKEINSCILINKKKYFDTHNKSKFLNTNINESIHKDQKRSISGAVETYLHDQVPQSLIDIARDIKQRK